MSDPTALIQLKKGGEVTKAAIIALLAALRLLLEGTDPAGIMAAIELVNHCRTGEPIRDEMRQILIRRALLQGNGVVHDDTKAIILSAVEGDIFNLHFVSPVAASDK